MENDKEKVPLFEPVSRKEWEWFAVGIGFGLLIMAIFVEVTKALMR